MLWRILPHANVCISSNGLTLLDVRQDRYFQVPPRLSEPMQAWLETRHACAPPPAIRDLLERAKVLRAGDTEPTNALRERVDIPSGISPTVESAMPAGKPCVSRIVATTWLRLRFLSLHHILSARAARVPLPVPRDASAISGAAELFERHRRLLPIDRNCLLDSLALDAWLARKGMGSHLVFGVAHKPFAAHCWLQTPETILNDSIDHVSRFTPILAQ